METQRLIANGFWVSERISPITSTIALGSRLCAPNEPRPPKLDTAAVSLCDEKPPSGPWIRGYSIPGSRHNTPLYFALQILPSYRHQDAQNQRMVATCFVVTLAFASFSAVS